MTEIQENPDIGGPLFWDDPAIRNQNYSKEFNKHIDNLDYLSKREETGDIIFDNLIEAIISCGQGVIYDENSKYYWNKHMGPENWYNDIIVNKVIDSLERKKSIWGV